MNCPRISAKRYWRYCPWKACGSRCVCKEWNVLFLSSKFITNRWAEAPPNKEPWLFLCRESEEEPVNSSAYCFFTQTWKNCSSLSFISKRSEYAKYGAFYRGSAQGMFLVDVYSDGPRRYYVCNPLTRVFLKLPSQSSIGYILTRDIVARNVGNQETYKVVVVGLSREWDVMIAETYDASEKSWVVVGHLPGNFDYFDLSRGIKFPISIYRGVLFSAMASSTLQDVDVNVVTPPGWVFFVSAAEGKFPCLHRSQSSLMVTP